MAVVHHLIGGAYLGGLAHQARPYAFLLLFVADAINLHDSKAILVFRAEVWLVLIKRIL